MELVSTDPVPLVREVAKEVMLVAFDKGLEVSTNVPEDAVSAAVDDHSFWPELLEVVSRIGVTRKPYRTAIHPKDSSRARCDGVSITGQAAREDFDDPARVGCGRLSLEEAPV